MKLTHKIKLIFARISWWFALTEKAKQYKEAKKNYDYYLVLYNEKLKQYLLEHKQNPTSVITHELNGQVKLLATILDIKP
jgi:hypothetical protein